MQPVINPLKAKLASGAPVLGIWSILNSAAISEIISWSGFDFVILDSEHGTHDIASLENCIRACDLKNTAALVRSPGLDNFFVQKCLDLGAHGVIVPQVR